MNVRKINRSQIKSVFDLNGSQIMNIEYIRRTASYAVDADGQAVYDNRGMRVELVPAGGKDTMRCIPASCLTDEPKAGWKPTADGYRFGANSKYESDRLMEQNNLIGVYKIDVRGKKVAGKNGSYVTDSKTGVKHFAEFSGHRSIGLDKIVSIKSGGIKYLIKD